MKIKDIAIFEKLNNLNINVFELRKGSDILVPILINKNYFEPQIDLLLYENHYCLKTNLYTFCRSHKGTTHLCRRCLNVYLNEDVL